jgi:hypothetical protein
MVYEYSMILDDASKYRLLFMVQKSKGDLDDAKHSAVHSCWLDHGVGPP